MNQKQKRSLPSVERSVTQVDAPPWEAYFSSVADEIGNGEPRRSDEFTVYDMMKRLNIHRSTAVIRLDKDVAEGKLKFRFLKLKQNKTKLYSLA
jgi:hypothetical protein